MPDIDDIIDRLLSDRRIQEGAAFSSRSYTDQPIIERGSDLKARMERERRNTERAAKHQRDAQARKARRAAKTVRATEPTSAPRRTDEPARAGSTPPLTFAELLFGKTNASKLGAAVAGVQSFVSRESQPKPIREMRRLESSRMPASLAYGANATGSLFYRQALLMADYEDDYEFHGDFTKYYPTYADMSDHQLRGYFSWRTRVRAGQVDPAPLSFAFVYVYELLCGIGTEPGAKGLTDLRAFGDAYREVDPEQGALLLSYLRRWESDYLIYHQLTGEMPPQDPHTPSAAALTLLAAEHTLLQEAKRAPRIANEAVRDSAPSTQELYQALSDASTYHLSTSRLAKDEPELVAAVACDVFEALVMHCSKRRKTDYVEGLFGYASRQAYAMFSAAVFHEPEPHPDCTVRVNDIVTFACKDGRWIKHCAIDARGRNSELGLALHAVDFELRRQLDYPYPLKERACPKYLQKIVSDAVARRLAEREEAKRRRITIDRSKLTGIRRAAALTQESLLTDDERSEVEVMPVEPPMSVPVVPTSTPAAPAPAPPASAPAPSAPAPTAPTPAVASIAPTATDGPFTPLELRFLAGLLDGTPVSQLLAPTDPFASVVVDSINEKLFDLIGDTAIEFDGDEPCIIEDYLEDVREVLPS